MTRLHFSRLRSNALDVETLLIRAQRFIILSHQVPRGNGFPSYLIHSRGKGATDDGLLRGCRNPDLGLREIRREESTNLRPLDIQEARRIGPERLAEAGRILLA